MNLKDRPDVVIFGPPGSGKSEQAKLLAAQGFRHLEMSAILDKRAEREDEEGLVLREQMGLGVMIPDTTTCELWRLALAKVARKPIPVVITGFPRTAAQVDHFIWRYPKLRKNRQLILIKIELDNHICIHRAGERKRDDDNSISRRLQGWWNDSVPAIEDLRRRTESDLQLVEGNQSIEKIHSDILDLVFPQAREAEAQEA